MHAPRLRVDLDDGHVGAERESRVRLLRIVFDHERLALAGGLPGDVRPVERRRGHAGDHEPALGREDDVLHRRLEFVGHGLSRTVEQETRALEDGGPGQLQGARSRRPTAAAHDGRVRLHETDAVHRDAQAVGDDRREGGRMALTVGGGACLHGCSAVVVHLNRSELAAGFAGHLYVGGDADPEQEPVTAPLLSACSFRRLS